MNKMPYWSLQGQINNPDAQKTRVNRLVKLAKDQGTENGGT